MKRFDLDERIATISAHRACCGSEHNPQQGKLHGYCVVCGVPYPCEYAGVKAGIVDEAEKVAPDPIIEVWKKYRNKDFNCAFNSALEIANFKLDMWQAITKYAEGKGKK